MEEKNQKCAVCQSAAVLICSSCSQVRYCSKEHQKVHWPTHKSQCRPYKICTNDKLGRYCISLKTDFHTFLLSVLHGSIRLNELDGSWNGKKLSVPRKVREIFAATQGCSHVDLKNEAGHEI